LEKDEKKEKVGFFKSVSNSIYQKPKVSKRLILMP